MAQNVFIPTRVAETLPYKCEKSVVFGNAAPGTFNIFSVTGLVKCKIYAVCITALVGAGATLEIGVTGATASIIAQTTATDIDINEIWHDNSPDSFLEASTVATENIIHGGGTYIFGTVATATITTGAIKFICEWAPISSDGAVFPV